MVAHKKVLAWQSQVVKKSQNETQEESGNTGL